MTSKAKDISTSFDVSKYTVSTEPTTETITIEGTGDTFDVSIKPLTWAKRNQLISRHLNWDADGNTSFSGDEYVRACLKEMIIEAPWGKTTEAFLISIDERLGKALEELVPQAFGTDDLTESETVKKGQ